MNSLQAPQVGPHPDPLPEGEGVNSLQAPHQVGPHPGSLPEGEGVNRADAGVLPPLPPGEGWGEGLRAPSRSEGSG